MGARIRKRQTEIPIGTRFTRWIVISEPVMRYTRSGKSLRKYYKCVCDCGAERYVIGKSLLTNMSTSCGCLRMERQYKKGRVYSMVMHHDSETRLYSIWKDMRRRCKSKTRRAYSLYGGRGITVCTEWDTSYIAFRDWALTHGYEEKLTIDRVDNDKGYSPDNYRWATYKEQANNQRARISTLTNGERVNLKAIARATGVKYTTFLQRLSYGVPLEIATQNKRIKFGERKPPKHSYLGGERLNVKALAQELGIEYTGFIKKLKNGIPLQEAIAQATSKHKKEE